MNFFNFRCFHCEQLLHVSHHGICSRCVKCLASTPYCGGCGSPLLEYRNSCGHCLANEPKWHRFVQICRYQAPLSEWVHRFKFQGDHDWDKALARLLLLAIRSAKRTHGLHLPEVIFPVPLFWQRQWKRGYNQAELLAKPLSAWLNIPLDTQSLRRVRATQPQRELSAQQRRRNLRNAFEYQPLQAYQRVAIVDDVVTTGSTMNSICAELLKQGVQEIQIWTLARA